MRCTRPSQCGGAAGPTPLATSSRPRASGNRLAFKTDQMPKTSEWTVSNRDERAAEKSTTHGNGQDMRTDHRREGCRANGLSSGASWREGQHVLLSFCLMARSNSSEPCRSTRTRIEDFKTLGPAAPPPRPPQKPPSLTLFYGLHPGGLGGPGEARRAQKQKRGFAPNIQPAGQILVGGDRKTESLFFIASKGPGTGAQESRAISLS